MKKNMNAKMFWEIANHMTKGIHSYTDATIVMNISNNVRALAESAYDAGYISLDTMGNIMGLVSPFVDRDYFISVDDSDNPFKDLKVIVTRNNGTFAWDKDQFVVKCKGINLYIAPIENNKWALLVRDTNDVYHIIEKNTVKMAMYVALGIFTDEFNLSVMDWIDNFAEDEENNSIYNVYDIFEEEEYVYEEEKYVF